jgi:hypothetical protein
LEVERRAVNCLSRQELDYEAEYIHDSRGCLQVRVEVVEIVWLKRLSRTGVARGQNGFTPPSPPRLTSTAQGLQGTHLIRPTPRENRCELLKDAKEGVFLQHFNSHDSDKALCCETIVISEHLLVIKNITLYTTSLTPAIRLLCIFRLCASLRTPITRTSHRNPASAPV